MAKEPFLTTTDDAPGDGPDVPGLTTGDGRGALARLLGERRLPRVPSLPSVPRPTLPRPSVSLPGRWSRRDAAAPDAASPSSGEEDTAPAPDAPGVDVPGVDVSGVDAAGVDAGLDAALEDALVEALADEDVDDAPDGAEPEGGALAEDRASDGDGERAGDEESGDDPDDLVTEWVRRAIDAYPRPSYPLEREWDVSVQGVVRLVPFVPRFATAPLALLDRFGALTIGPRRVGLDGKDVDWERVVEVRTAPAWTCLSAEALEANLAELVVALPPVPGRAWVLRRISELLLSLYLAVMPPDDDGTDVLADAHALLGAYDGGTGRKDPTFDRVVTHVVYRRRFGTGEAQASATSVLLQLALRGATDVVVRTAEERGVDVVHVRAEDTSVGSVVARAATWRRTALDLRERVDRRVRRR
ncbi:hypothetical protein [Cellulosimicrobium composti]|uniref:hypothetical protein n=1 Tax=Cellulosimicrobium composti TaxID=2672572 RepID=UPI0037AA2E3F